jgi:hypothetical protein
MTEVIHRDAKRSSTPRIGPERARIARSGPGVRPPAAATLGEAVLRLQRAAGNAGVTELIRDRPEDATSVRRVVATSGRPIEEPVRRLMERRFGRDFADVRIHTDDAADRSARTVNADAYTVGSHIAFRRDRYRPGATPGLRVLAHELAHVVQQRNGPVAGRATAGGIQMSDPSDRFERDAERVATHVMAGSRPEASTPPEGRATAGGAGRRPPSPDPVQTRRPRDDEEDPDKERDVQRFASNERPTRNGGSHADPAAR